MTWNVRQLAGSAGGNVPSISLLRLLYKRKCRTQPLVLVSLTEDILMFAGTTLMVSRLDADQDLPCWHPGSERLDELASPWARRDEGEEDVEEEEDEDDDEDDALGDGDEDLDEEDDDDEEDFDDEDEDLDDDEFDDEDFDDLDDEDEDFDELDDDDDDLDDDDDEDEDEDEAEESTGP
jgi:hypothetical protein